MNDAEILDLLDIVLGAAREAGIRVLIGVLKTDLASMLSCIEKTMAHIRESTGKEDGAEALLEAGAAGFTVCPPKGAQISQDRIREGLKSILELGLPTALYQLPQVTENEMSPGTLKGLANAFPNFYLFKDTSGDDRVANSGLDFGGVFFVRGAEGRYSKWLKAAGGPYDGFLLSTANSFARELYQIQALQAGGRQEDADALSERLTAVIEEVFASVEGVEAGNAFTNANKVLDHFMAFGARAEEQAAPLLYSGVRIPAEVLEVGRDILDRSEFLPEKGYLPG